MRFLLPGVASISVGLMALACATGWGAAAAPAAPAFRLASPAEAFLDGDPFNGAQVSSYGYQLQRPWLGLEARQQQDRGDPNQHPGARHPDAPPAANGTAELFFIAAAHHKQAPCLWCL